MGSRLSACIAVTVAVALVIGFAAPAAALTVLLTPEISVGASENLFCRIVNGGPRTITVNVEILDSLGNVIVDVELTAFPNGSTAAGLNGPASGHCRFAGTFSKSLVRGSIERLVGVGTVSVAPAQ